MERWLLAACLMVLGQATGPARTGPETEKRFPPLKVPPGFKATLFACDPLIEYPSVLALGPRPGSVFVARDYMTGLGTEIVRRDEIHRVEDTDGDGYADRSTVYAEGFNSIQGLSYHDGWVYAMHAPLLTALRDTDGDGVADERRDLLSGLGWPPEKAPDRLHCANGVVAGHDGWLYLALGDRGCDVKRPEGDRLVLHGGGILRCRPDGSDLHVFSTGLRNIYDIALDEELNVFVRDNENDGGTYMVRFCHSFFGADHGYPYLYEEHPGEALAPLADLGRGSSAGGTSYLERAFPASYRGDLFFCEWGRSVVRYRRERAGGGFASMKEIEFATGAPGDPYGFKPTDLVVDRDGSLLVADWADDQRPKRGRGRLYRIRYQGQEGEASPGLESESYHARLDAQAAIERGGLEEARALIERLERMGVLGRLHAIWVIARAGGDAVATLFRIAESDPDPRVRAQAVRAVADLTDPVLAKHRLEAGRGDPEIARRLAALGRGQDPRVALEVTIALGRLRWAEAPAWLRENLVAPDPTLAHAAQGTLRSAQNWPAVLEWLDAPDDSPLRPIALRAAGGRAEAQVVDGLLQRLQTSGDPRRRREYADLLTRVDRKPGPWAYWGFRPGPRPPNTESWERTQAIEDALDRTLGDPDRAARLATLLSMRREKVAARPETLIRWLREEGEEERIALLLAALREAPAGKIREALEEVVGKPARAVSNRLLALEMLVRGLDASSEGRLLEIAGSLEDSPVLAEALRQLGRRPGLDSRGLLLRRLRAPTAEVRIAAIESLEELGTKDAGGALLDVLEDREAKVRAAAASAVGKLGVREAAERLLVLAQDPDSLVRARSLRALARFHDRRALSAALRALDEDGEAQLAALEWMAEAGGPDQAESVTALATRSRSVEVLQAAVRALWKWRQAEAVARVQGASGVLLQWKFGGPLAAEAAARALEPASVPAKAAPEGWQEVLAQGADSRLGLGEAKDGSFWLGFSDFLVPEPFRAQFLASSSGTLQVWLNGWPVHNRLRPGAYAADSDRFEGDLREGLNRLAVQVSSVGPAELQVRFRRKSSLERHERLTQLALSAQGNPDRGRKLFFNAERCGCIKCHRLKDQGGRVGPDLSGAGRRFSRIHLVESILEPSRVVAPAFQNLAVRLKVGQVLLVGVKVAETESAITLGDAQGQPQVIQKDRIERIEPLEVSIMPEGIEKGLSDLEFADLIAFLAEER
jgi:putative membrane-bound dehydrogenase-like protein